MQNKRIILTLVALLLLATTLSFSPFISSSAATAAGTGDAKVRVVHASPNAPAVDVWVNGSIAFSDLSFKDISAYASLPSGTYNVQVVPHGKTSPVLINAVLTLSPNTDYTVMAIGLLNHIHPLVLVDNNSPVSPSMVRVRFVHAAVGAGRVDIAVVGGPILFRNVGFGEDAGYITVPKGTYDLEVLAAGTHTVLLSLGNITFAGGSVYTAFAVGWAHTNSITAILSQDSSSGSANTVLQSAIAKEVS